MNLKLKSLLFGMLLPALLHGQEAGLLRMNLDSVANRSVAAVWGGIEEGGFRPTYAAALQWTAGAEAQTVRHGKFTSWTGSISFEQMMGNKMGSSMFLEPGYFPLDIVETVKGTKSRQTFKMEAAFLTDFGYEWAAGMKASLKGINVSKKQEIPHSGFGLDLLLEPVLTYVMDDDMGLVSSYHIRLRTENYKVQASGEAQPFLDLGMRYGSYEEGLSPFPVMEFAHGFNELLYNPELSVGLEITWKRGMAGEDYTRFKFPGSTLKAFVEQKFLADEMDHVYSVSYQRQRDQLREDVQALSDRRGRNLDLKYEARFLGGVVKSVGIDLDGNQWTERFLKSPIYDSNKWYDGAATFLASFSYGSIDLDVNMLAAKGWWKGRAKADEAVNGETWLGDDWFRNMDYRTAPRIGMGGTLTVRATDALFVQLYAYWHHALKVTRLPGMNREIATLKVGYKF